MSFFTALGAPKGLQAKAPQIRKVQRVVPKPLPPPPVLKAKSTPQPSPHQSATNTSSSRSTPRTNAVTSARSSPATSASTGKRKASSRDTVDRASAIRRSTKRRLATPPDTPIFGSSSESEDGADEDVALKAAASRKRVKNGINGTNGHVRRRLRDVAHWDDTGEAKYKLVHSADLIKKKEHIPLFGRSVEDAVAVDLFYPGLPNPERFLLASPKDQQDHHPDVDLITTVTTILQHFFPSRISEPLLDESLGLPYLMRRAFRNQDLPALQEALTTFNNLIKSYRLEGTLATYMDTEMPGDPLSLKLAEHIFTQHYSRTISPNVERLTDYVPFSDTVYGEIKPGFASRIFQETGLTSPSVFLDLGSGVGNVVLQAALEIGCEAHGIELKPNPAGLATQQAQEFRSRCRLYGIKPGRVNLVHGSFLSDERILRDVLPRADVILVNNYAFGSDTNDSLKHIFLDAKEGARIVSLKSFVPAKWRLEDRTSGDIAAVLRIERKDFYSDSVSWTDTGGEWFLQTKDSRALRAFLEQQQGEGRRGR